MTEMINKQLARIKKMDSVSLAEYKQSVIKYSVPSLAKTTILEACDKKLEALNRDSSMIEYTDMSDMGSEE